MWGNIAAIFIIVGLLSKNISLLRDMKYMGGFYWHLPGIQKHFVVVRISFLRDFVIEGFDCTRKLPGTVLFFLHHQF